jgi:hypothetical protein
MPKDMSIAPQLSQKGRKPSAHSRSQVDGTLAPPSQPPLAQHVVVTALICTTADITDVVITSVHGRVAVLCTGAGGSDCRTHRAEIAGFLRRRAVRLKQADEEEEPGGRSRPHHLGTH